MASRFVLPFADVGDGISPSDGAKLFFFQTGTSTPKNTYSDSALTTPNANPVIADSNGVFSDIFLQSGDYKVQLKDKNDVQIWEADPISGAATLSETVIVFDNVADMKASASLSIGDAVQTLGYTTPNDGGGATYRIVAAATGADDGGSYHDLTGISGQAELIVNGVVNIKQFGAATDGSDSAPAIEAALAFASVVDVPTGNFTVKQTITGLATGNKTLRGVQAGGQAQQLSKITHDAAATGELFNLESAENGGAAIEHLTILGGNGTWAIVSSRPYVRYSYLHMEPYNGGGIQFKGTVTPGDSFSSLVDNCQWVGPNSATSFTGFEIDLAGGDVRLYRCTAIRGAIGINVLTGQTVTIDQCSVNKQSTLNGLSSAADTDTCGIRLTGTTFKEAISIRHCYIEACTNGIYVEACQSLSIEDNHIADNGVSGVVGAVEKFGNHLIHLVGSNCKNVTIRNNNLRGSSNGKSGVDDYFAVRVGTGVNGVTYVNNNIQTVGDFGTHFKFEAVVNAMTNLHTASSNPGTNVGAELIHFLDKGLKAFAKWNGVAGVSISNQHKITSITRLAAGDYEVTLDESLPNAITFASAENEATHNALFTTTRQSSNTVVRVKVASDSATLVDGRNISFAVFG